MRTKNAFTILELLIVIAVIGLMLTLALLSLQSARARTRDAQRISDITALRNALSGVWFERSSYPTSGGVDLGKAGTNTTVLSSNGFSDSTEVTGTVYLPRVPTGPTVNEFYRYKSNGNGYSICFKTESETILGIANVYCAHSNGIDKEDIER